MADEDITFTVFCPFVRGELGLRGFSCCLLHYSSEACHVSLLTFRLLLVQWMRILGRLCSLERSEATPGVELMGDLNRG